MRLSEPMREALRIVGGGRADLRQINEATRQEIISAAMRDPPLVDVDADQPYLTPAGREAIGMKEGEDNG